MSDVSFQHDIEIMPAGDNQVVSILELLKLDVEEQEKKIYDMDHYELADIISDNLSLIKERLTQRQYQNCMDFVNEFKRGEM